VSALLLLMLCAVSSPLGPDARPGVPVALVVKGEAEIVVDGWRYPGEPLTVVYPATLPCTVRAADGRELLRLEPVPKDTLLVGLEDGASLPDAPGRLSTPIRTAGLAAEDWPCLDVFDHVIAPRSGPALEAWVWAGGTVTRPGEPADPRVLPALRPGNRGRPVYDVMPSPEAESAAARTMRLVVWGAGTVMALQVLLLRRRRFAAGLVGVALVGAVVGFVRTRADYDPVLVTRIHVHYEGGTWFRERIYTAYAAASPTSFEAPARGVPVFYRAPGDPWWPAADRRCPLEPGIIRLFVEDRAGAIGLGGGTTERGKLAPLVPYLTPPAGRWRAQLSPGWSPGPPRVYLSQD
jgi:hypothetical protein